MLNVIIFSLLLKSYYTKLHEEDTKDHEEFIFAHLSVFFAELCVIIKILRSAHQALGIQFQHSRAMIRVNGIRQDRSMDQPACETAGNHMVINAPPQVP
jgi:hypothetical protein